LKRRYEVTAIEFAIAIPVARSPRRISDDLVFVLAGGEDDNEIGRVKLAIEV